MSERLSPGEWGEWRWTNHREHLKELYPDAGWTDE